MDMLRATSARGTSPPARLRAPSPGWSPPGAPPTPCCTSWPSPARPGWSWRSTTSTASPAARPDLRPQAGGRFVAVDLDRAGHPARRPAPGGGGPDGRLLPHPQRPDHRRGRLRRAGGGAGGGALLDNPLKPSGGLVILKGNIAPEGCVEGGRLRAHLPPRPGPGVRARGGRHGAVTGGQIKAGDVMVIRYEGPRGGRGCGRCWASPGPWSAPAWARASPSSPTGASRGPRTA